MRCRFLIIAACIALAACGKVTIQSASADTVGSADASYIAAEAVGEVAVANKKVSAAEFHKLADDAYAALCALRAARTAGVSQNILSASNALTTALAALNALGSK